MQIIFFRWLCETNAEAKAWGQDLALFEGTDQSQYLYVNFRRQHIQDEPALKQNVCSITVLPPLGAEPQKAASPEEEVMWLGKSSLEASRLVLIAH